MEIKFFDDLCLIDEHPMTPERMNNLIHDLGIENFELTGYRPFKMVPEKLAKKRTQKIIDRMVSIGESLPDNGKKVNNCWKAFRAYYGIGRRELSVQTIRDTFHLHVIMTGTDKLESAINRRLKHLRGARYDKWRKLLLILLFLPEPRYVAFMNALHESMTEVDVLMRRMENVQKNHTFYKTIEDIV